MPDEPLAFAAFRTFGVPPKSSDSEARFYTQGVYYWYLLVDELVLGQSLANTANPPGLELTGHKDDRSSYFSNGGRPRTTICTW